jgi:hypothetical protein
MGGYVQNLQKAKQQKRFGTLVMWSVWVVDVGIVSCRVRFPNPSLGREVVGRWCVIQTKSNRKEAFPNSKTPMQPPMILSCRESWYPGYGVEPTDPLSFSSSLLLHRYLASPAQTGQQLVHITLLDLLHLQAPRQTAILEPVHALSDLVRLLCLENKNVFFVLKIPRRSSEDVQSLGLGHTSLHQADGPSLDVPLSLPDLANVIVDEKGLGFYLEDETIGDGALARDELGDGLVGEGVREEVDGADLDLVGIVC